VVAGWVVAGLVLGVAVEAALADTIGATVGTGGFVAGSGGPVVTGTCSILRAAVIGIGAIVGTVAVAVGAGAWRCTTEGIGGGDSPRFRQATTTPPVPFPTIPSAAPVTLTGLMWPLVVGGSSHCSAAVATAETPIVAKANPHRPS
jgi:hypothetical protein